MDVFEKNQIRTDALRICVIRVFCCLRASMRRTAPDICSCTGGELFMVMVDIAVVLVRLVIEEAVAMCVR